MVPPLPPIHLPIGTLEEASVAYRQSWKEPIDAYVVTITTHANRWVFSGLANNSADSRLIRSDLRNKSDMPAV